MSLSKSALEIRSEHYVGEGTRGGRNRALRGNRAGVSAHNGRLRDVCTLAVQRREYEARRSLSRLLRCALLWSPITTFEALRPGMPMTPPPGWVPEPQR